METDQFVPSSSPTNFDYYSANILNYTTFAHSPSLYCNNFPYKENYSHFNERIDYRDANYQNIFGFSNYIKNGSAYAANELNHSFSTEDVSVSSTPSPHSNFINYCYQREYESPESQHEKKINDLLYANEIELKYCDASEQSIKYQSEWNCCEDDYKHSKYYGTTLRLSETYEESSSDGPIINSATSEEISGKKLLHFS